MSATFRNSGGMRVLIATDAWHPQVNGVVRTLSALRAQLERMGVEVVFLSPEGFPSFPAPTYPELRLAVPNGAEIAHRIDTVRPDAIHIATEGPIGLAVRAYCRSRGLPFTTSFMTKFPEYLSVRFGIPEQLAYWTLRRFHAAARLTMVSTRSLFDELRGRGFRKIGMWTRGVDTDLFRPIEQPVLDLPRPIFVNVGRVAVEKNLGAFLSLDLPGSKVVIGDGPQLPELRQKFPQAHFLGKLEGERLAAHLASADVFVFPSKTDTFGIVQLEALACGVPVAAYPVMGPRDVIGGTDVGALDEDLAIACRAALGLSRQSCRDFALSRSWGRSAQQFLRNIGHAVIRPAPSLAA